MIYTSTSCPWQPYCLMRGKPRALLKLWSHIQRWFWKCSTNMMFCRKRQHKIWRHMQGNFWNDGLIWCPTIDFIPSEHHSNHELNDVNIAWHNWVSSRHKLKSNFEGNHPSYLETITPAAKMSHFRVLLRNNWRRRNRLTCKRNSTFLHIDTLVSVGVGLLSLGKNTWYF